jgi:chemotaxis protein MotB
VRLPLFLTRMPVRPLLTAAVCLLTLSGCASSTQPLQSVNTTAPDSLRAENARLQDQNRALRDSLEFQNDLESGQYYRDLRALEDRLNQLTYEVSLLRDGGFTVTVLSTDSLFESGGATLSAAGTDRLRALARQLQSTYPNRTVRVEGHADDRALSDAMQEQFPTNWELSSARATAVVRQLLELTDLDRTQFVAVGYGATRPRASNDTARGRFRNRRVRVAVLPQPRDYSRPFQTTW